MENVSKLLERSDARLAGMETKLARGELLKGKGMGLGLLGDELRMQAVGRYFLTKNIQPFVSNLTRATKISMDMLQMHDAGKEIADSFVTMTLHPSLYDALAVGDLELSKQLAKALGGRDAIEKKLDHPFDYTMGYTLKYFVLGDQAQMPVWSKKLAEVCSDKETKDFKGYAEAFQAILDKDSKQLNRGFENLLAGHRKQSKGNGAFADTEDELMCVWGVGLANLAMHYGLKVDVKDELLPRELIQGLK